MALRYYNWEQLQDADTSYSLNANTGGPSSISVWQSVGGPTVGMSFDLTQQVGSKLTINFNAKYDDAHPIWDGYEPQLEMLGLVVRCRRLQSGRRRRPVSGRLAAGRLPEQVLRSRADSANPDLGHQLQQVAVPELG